MEHVEKESTLVSSGEIRVPVDCDSERASNLKEKESNFLEEQPQERRSTRLESLRSRKPGKEELDFTAGKDLAKFVLQLFEPFVISKPEGKVSDDINNCSVSCADQTNAFDMECRDVSNFVRETSKNYSAYHMGHLLLEHGASRSLVHPDARVKFLELEKLLRNWGQDRTPECSLFLAELYYDIGSSTTNSSNLSEFLSEASYHLCKIVESLASDHPFHVAFVQLPHCKISKELTVDRILHEISLLKVDLLLEKTLGEMIEKGMYRECITMLAPLLFSRFKQALESLGCGGSEGNFTMCVASENLY